MTTHIFIDGAVGTTGLEIADRLEGRRELTLISLDEAQRKDIHARKEAINAADIVILCLPDEAARDAVSLIENPHTRVIDASTAHRISPDWTFGFPELVGREAVANALRVSNPGCYSTGFLALVTPLVRAGLIPVDWPLTCNAVSGYSGGGKAMIAEFVGRQTVTAWRSYALTLAHKHVPEMQKQSGLTHAPLFAPSVVRTYRGMVVDVPLMIGAMPGQPSVADICAALAAQYEASPVVRFHAAYDDATISIEYAADSDRLDLFAFANETGTQLRLVAALDNLGKGAAGACVQSLNLMAGLLEATGLRL